MFLSSETPRPADSTLSNGHEVSTSRRIVVIGCSGHARVVVDAIKAAGRLQIVGFLDTYKRPGTEMLGYEILGSEADLPSFLKEGVCDCAVVAIGDNWTRRQAVVRLQQIAPDVNFVSVIHPTAIIANDVSIGEGTVVLAGAIVSVGSRIGRFCILNTKSSLDHDGRMGAFSSMAPGVITGGGVTIGDFSTLCIGATLTHDVNIGEHTVVGAAATVLNDIPGYVVAYGTPAKVVRSRQRGDAYLGERASNGTVPYSLKSIVTAFHSHSVKLIRASDSSWTAYLDGIPHDFYQTRGYHLLHEEFGGDEAWLAVYEDGPKRFLWPYLKRDISGSGRPSKSLCDVTGVYGYAGPLANEDAASEQQFLGSALKELVTEWHRQGVVSIFTRFHPLLENHRFFCTQQITESGWQVHGECSSSGKTVVIDLTRSQEEVWAAYPRQLRHSIGRSRDSGLSSEWDPEWRHLDEFVALYYETMKRNNASPFYYFPVEYFRTLKQVAGEHGSLIVTKHSGEVLSIGLLFEYQGVVSLHLLANSSQASHLSPSKLTIHDAQTWARARGNRLFHLGGGRGNRDDDALFQFKARFSRVSRPFFTGRWIVDKSTYNFLSEARRQRGIALGKAMADETFFPFYRAPIN